MMVWMTTGGVEAGQGRSCRRLIGHVEEDGVVVVHVWGGRVYEGGGGSLCMLCVCVGGGEKGPACMRSGGKGRHQDAEGWAGRP